MYNKFFSHIYVERQALEYETTGLILKKFKNSEIIYIDHYKDVFSRKHQDFMDQKNCQSIILAVNNEKSVYKGAPVCQSFGNEHFYYCSNIKNCIFDCEYCYLQGMYTSANIVIYVNIEDIFKEVDSIAEKHPVYLCISYDTDLIALDGITGFLAKWNDYVCKRKNITIELRTKCGYSSFIENCSNYINDNMIFAWTLSPDFVINRYEHKTAQLKQRLKAVNYVINNGGRIHLCFDPLIYCEDFEQVYGEMFKEVFSAIDSTKVEGVSIGTFRISKAYLKNMRKNRVSAVTYYPYECHNGVYEYGDEINSKMLGFAREKIEEYISADIIFEGN